MQDTDNGEGTVLAAPVWANWARNFSFFLLVAILGWAPFPLGSNREQSWSFLMLLVAASWIFLALWILAKPETHWQNFKRLAIPLCMAGLTLCWAVLQTLPIVPSGWVHPVWPMTSTILNRSLSGTISLNPWRTWSEVPKLCTYVSVAGMTFILTRGSVHARWMLNAIITIGAGYALYAFALALIGTSQFTLFYSLPTPLPYLSGAFVGHNSFATFEGLTSLTALARLVELASEKILASKGPRRLVLTTTHFLFGSGALIVIAALLTISALVASASRGGFIATCVALIIMAALSIRLLKRKPSRRWILMGGCAVILAFAILVGVNGDVLNSRMTDFIEAGNADAIRLALWAAAWRMTQNAPLLGLGLGTFQDAYPMYAIQMFPFVMDKAHCDYLEFAAGLGWPAAICWWGAIIWCAGQMIRGTFKRRKDRIYSLVGIGSTVLVAVHSSVDFSLQIPAVSVLYAALSGLGLAQSYSTLKKAA